MKKLLLVSMLVLGGISSFARDNTYNERRDIVKPVEENIDKMSRYTHEEWQQDKELTKENIQKYSEFHRELEEMDRGHENR